MIRKMIVAAVSGLAAIALPGIGHAQTTSQSIAQCVADNDGRHVSKFLETVPGSAAELAAKHALSSSYRNCMDGTKTVGLQWRDRAELALAATTNRLAGHYLDVAVTPRAVSMSANAADGGDPQAGALRAFGECIVSAAPNASLTLVRADAGSAEEKAAVGQMLPAISPCVTADQTIKFTPTQLRLIVAEPLYHAIAR